MADKTQKPGAGAPERIMMPALHREASIVADSLDEKQRTFDIVWTAGAEVPRIDWWTGQRYIEVLQVDAASIRLDRLESGRAPVLDSHQRWQLGNVMGVIEKGTTKIADGAARATVRMSNREDLAGLVADIRDGIIANVSPGYITHAYREEVRDSVTYRTATDWEPIEISFVPVGADPDAGLARSLADPKRPEVDTYPCLVTRTLVIPPPAASSAAALARMRMRARALGL